MYLRILLPISVLALFLTSCTLGGKQKNSGSVVQSTKPSPIGAPALSTSPTPASIFATNNSSSVVSITGGNYDEVVKSQGVALIVFWAPWSAPDRLMIPVIEALANEYSHSVKTGEVNIDDNPELAEKFGIVGIPTVVVIKDGTERERVVGVAPKKSISALLDKHLSRNP